MSKSRRPSPRRSASASSRKPASRAAAARKKGKRKPSPRSTSGGVELKPIRDQIVAAVESLKKFEQTEAIKITIERLQRCLVEFDDICDPESPDGCGTTMAFWP